MLGFTPTLGQSRVATTRERLLVQMKLDHATNSSRLGVIVVVTTTKSYDVLLRGVVLYSMGF